MSLIYPKMKALTGLDVKLAPATQSLAARLCESEFHADETCSLVIKWPPSVWPEVVKSALDQRRHVCYSLEQKNQ